jgi:hypothetical protein
MYIYAASVGRHPWRSSSRASLTTKVTAIPKTSDCDEFNWLGDTNDTLLNSSLLLLVWSLTGLTFPVGTERVLLTRRSPLAPLNKGGTRAFKVPLIKGDLGGSEPNWKGKKTRYRNCEL